MSTSQGVPRGEDVKLTLRVTAFWIGLVAASFLLFAMIWTPPRDRIYSDEGPEPTIATDQPAKMRGVWLLFACGLLAATELWRQRRIGPILSAAFLIFLSAGGLWVLWRDGFDVMSATTIGLNLLLAAGLVRPVAWRACRRFI